MVQKLEELHGSGAAPYSDASCSVVSLASTSLAWSDWTVLRLHPLQLLLPHCVCLSLLLPNCVLFSCCCWSASTCCHAHVAQTIVSLHIHYRFHIYACCYIFGLLVGILSSNKWPFAITCSENGGWTYFLGRAYFWETTVQLKCHGSRLLQHNAL